MKIQKILLEEEFINSIEKVFNNNIIKTALDNKMWIAGGFAREVSKLYFNSTTNSLKNNMNHISNYLVRCDIDFFGHSKEQINRVLNGINLNERKKPLTIWERMARNNYVSEGPFAKTIFYSPLDLLSSKYSDDNAHEPRQFTVQLVDKFLFNSIHDTFSSFDFTNCRYAIEKKNNKYILHYDLCAWVFDKQKTLNIEHNNSHLLARRIYKYLKYKDIEKVNPESKDLITEFFYKVLANNWGEYFENARTSIVNKSLQTAINDLHSIRLLSQEDMSMFVGKWKKIVYSEEDNIDSYGALVKVYDWATISLNELSRANFLK